MSWSKRKGGYGNFWQFCEIYWYSLALYQGKYLQGATYKANLPYMWKFCTEHILPHKTHII